MSTVFTFISKYFMEIFIAIFALGLTGCSIHHTGARYSVGVPPVSAAVTADIDIEVGLESPILGGAIKSIDILGLFKDETALKEDE